MSLKRLSNPVRKSPESDIRRYPEHFYAFEIPRSLGHPQRIAKRRGKKRAIIAIARMILTAVYQMLSSGEVWNPVDLNQVDMPPELHKKEVQHTLKQALKLLIAHSIIPPDTIQIPVSAPS